MLAILQAKGVGREIGIVAVEKNLGQVLITQVSSLHPAWAICPATVGGTKKFYM